LCTYLVIRTFIFYSKRMTTRQQQCEKWILGERPFENLTLTVYLKGRWDFRPFVKPTFVLVAARKRCNILRGERRWKIVHHRLWRKKIGPFCTCDFIALWRLMYLFWLHEFVNLYVHFVIIKFVRNVQWNTQITHLAVLQKMTRGIVECCRF
jgi:hypothetical protein